MSGGERPGRVGPRPLTRCDAGESVPDRRQRGRPSVRGVRRSRSVPDAGVCDARAWTSDVSSAMSPHLQRRFQCREDSSRRHPHLAVVRQVVAALIDDRHACLRRPPPSSQTLMMFTGLHLRRTERGTLSDRAGRFGCLSVSVGIASSRMGQDGALVVLTSLVERVSPQVGRLRNQAPDGALRSARPTSSGLTSRSV
jgi:hypothetical protein